VNIISIARNEDTILPGALDPKPCAICGEPVYSDLQQTLSEDIYGVVICVHCESSYICYRWGLF